MTRRLLALALSFLVAGAARADSSVPAPIPEGAEFSRAVHFLRGVIDPNDRPVIAAVIAAMQRNPHVTLLRVDGHTDARGDESWNLRLSQKRADLVADELVAGGVARARIATRAFGESQPIDPRPTAEAWAKNSRVEFTVVAVDGKAIAHR